MPEVSISSAMREQQQNANRNFCRIKEWKLTREQAWDLAVEICPPMNNRHCLAMYSGFLRGDGVVMGARIRVTNQ
jgi:hypothetical protein